MDPGETPRQAALREANEEISLPTDCTQGSNPLVVMRRDMMEADHISWKYTTFVGDVMRPFDPRRPPGDTESVAVEWAPIDQVGKSGGKYFPLLPAFWEIWDTLREMVRTMGPPPRVNAPAQINPPVRPPQPGQPIQPSQGIGPALGVQPILRLTKPHATATAPRNTRPTKRTKEKSDEDEDEESLNPEGTAGDKEEVPDKPAKRARTSSAAVESEDEEEISGRYVSSFRVDRSFRGGRIGYMSWNAEGRHDPACLPS